MSGESINPNTPVTNPTTTESGKIEVESGGGPTTFAELEAVMTAKKGRPKAEAKEEKKSEKSQDLTSDDKKGSNADKKAESKSESKEKVESKSEKTDKEEPPKRKTYKGKYQEQEYELDEEAEFLVKTNGKDEPWKLKDLLADKSGRTAWDKKFTEIDKKDKEVKSREGKVLEIAKTIQQMNKTQDPDERLMLEAKLGGMDPIEHRKAKFKELENYVEKYYSLTDHERAVADAAFEAKVHKQRADTMQSKFETEEADKVLNQKITEAIASHQVPENEFYGKLDYLDQQVRAGKLDASHLSIENAVQLVKADMLWNPAKEALDALKLDWPTEQRNAALQNIVKNALAIGLDPKDIPDVVDEVYGAKNAQRKIQQKQEKNQEFTSGKKEVLTHKVRTDSDPTFFSDI